MKWHPLADAFPLLKGPEFGELVEDIRCNGLIEPIITYKGLGLDGRNRYNACQAAGVKPEFREWDGSEGGILDYIASKNLYRRHLEHNERAWIGAQLADILAEQRGTRAPVREAAKAAKVSERSLKQMRATKRGGVPELVEAVKTGKVSVAAGAKLAKRTPQEQLASIQDEHSKLKRANQAADRQDDMAQVARLLARVAAILGRHGLRVADQTIVKA